MNPRRGLSLGQIGQKISPTGEYHPHQGMRRRTRQSRITFLSVDVSECVAVPPIRNFTVSLAASGVLNGKPPPNFVHGHTIKATIQDLPNGMLVTMVFILRRG